MSFRNWLDNHRYIDLVECPVCNQWHPLNKLSLMPWPVFKDGIGHHRIECTKVGKYVFVKANDKILDSGTVYFNGAFHILNIKTITLATYKQMDQGHNQKENN